MGKDLKGHELCKGLTQRKDGKYSAKLKLHTGKRPEKTFDSLADAKQWLIDARYKDSHEEISHNPGITVQEFKEEVEEDDKKIDFFTVEEEKRFIEVAKHYSNYPVHRLILELGLRTSEVIGLQWKYVNLKKRELKVVTTLENRYSQGGWTWGPPKTKHGRRTVKLTPVGVEILKSVKEGRCNIKEETPEEFRDLVFLNRTGFPTKTAPIMLIW
ncbi:MAG: hypothetical protein K6F69_01030 [Treponema sp.]|nr:hypothetical protein [Treponema sp.]